MSSAKKDQKGTKLTESGDTDYEVEFFDEETVKKFTSEEAKDLVEAFAPELSNLELPEFCEKIQELNYMQKVCFKQSRKKKQREEKETTTKVTKLGMKTLKEATQDERIAMRRMVRGSHKKKQQQGQSEQSKASQKP